MKKVKKLGYQHVYPEWLAPSGRVYRIEQHELKRRFYLFSGSKLILQHINSDVLLLHLLKHELGWRGNLKRPLSPQEQADLKSLEHAVLLSFQGSFIL